MDFRLKKFLKVKKEKVKRRKDIAQIKNPKAREGVKEIRNFLKTKITKKIQEEHIGFTHNNKQKKEEVKLSVPYQNTSRSIESLGRNTEQLKMSGCQQNSKKSNNFKTDMIALMLIKT